MRRILFVSRHYASDFSTKVGGIFQRMRMLLEAAAKSADGLDILFIVDQYMIDQAGPQPAQKSLKEHWGIAATVYLTPRATKTHGRVANMLQSMFNFRAQEDFFRFNGKAVTKAIRSHVRPDTELVIAHRLYIAAAVVAALPNGVPIVMDLDDIEHRNLARQLRRPPHSLSKRLRYLELPALFAGETATIRACRTSFVCSQADRDYLSKKGADNTIVIPNAIRFSDPEEPRSLSATLFFIGTYGYPPNADAAEYLVRSVFPFVREIRPDVRLLIAGEAIEKLPSFSAPPQNVEFVGFVPDLAEVYRRVTVVCCPMLAGGGTRIKIIEAAAHRKPVVSTTIGAEGLDFLDGEEILLRDSPSTFANACVDLLNDPVHAKAIGDAAYRKARSTYDREAVIEKIARTFRDVATVPS